MNFAKVMVWMSFLAFNQHIIIILGAENPSIHSSFLPVQVVNLLTVCGIDKETLTLPDHMNSIEELMVFIHKHIKELSAEKEISDSVQVSNEKLVEALMAYPLPKQVEVLVEQTFALCYAIRNSEWKIALNKQFTIVFDDFIEKAHNWNTVALEETANIIKAREQTEVVNSEMEFEEMGSKVMGILRSMDKLKARHIKKKQKKPLHDLRTPLIPEAPKVPNSRKVGNYYYGYGVPYHKLTKYRVTKKKKLTDQDQAGAGAAKSEKPNTDSDSGDAVVIDEATNDDAVSILTRKKRAVNDGMKAKFDFELIPSISRESRVNINISLIKNKAVIDDHINASNGDNSGNSAGNTHSDNTALKHSHFVENYENNSRILMEGNFIFQVKTKRRYRTRNRPLITYTARKYEYFMIDKISNRRVSDKQSFKHRLVETSLMKRRKRRRKRESLHESSGRGARRIVTPSRKRRSNNIPRGTIRRSRRNDGTIQPDSIVNVLNSRNIDLPCMDRDDNSPNDTKMVWSVDRGMGLGFIPLTIRKHYSVTKTGILRMAKPNTRDTALFLCEVSGRNEKDMIVKRHFYRKLIVYIYPKYYFEVHFHYKVESCTDTRINIKEEEIRMNVVDFACKSDPHTCTVKNIRIHCKFHIFARLYVKLDIVLPNTYIPPTCDEECVREDMNDVLYKVYEKIEGYQESEKAGQSNRSKMDESFALIEKSLKYVVQESCLGGYYKSVFACVPCSPGHYTTNETSHRGVCKKCNINSYQHEFAQELCLACPPGTITLVTGATSISQCIVIKRDELEDKKNTYSEKIEKHSVPLLIIMVIVSILFIISYITSIIVCLTRRKVRRDDDGYENYAFFERLQSSSKSKGTNEDTYEVPIITQKYTSSGDVESKGTNEDTYEVPIITQKYTSSGDGEQGIRESRSTPSKHHLTIPAVRHGKITS